MAPADHRQRAHPGHTTVLGTDGHTPSVCGGAVAPPLLPAPFAFVSQWLPSGATVIALRNPVYFPTCQHPAPIAVLASWATAIFAAKLLVSESGKNHGRAMWPSPAPLGRGACE